MKIFIYSIYGVIAMFYTFPCNVSAAITNYTSGNSILYLTVHKNILWAGTNGGLVRWDLKDFSYTKIGTDGKLPQMKVTGIAFDSKDNMWIGTHMGVVKYDMKKWQFFGIKNGIPSPWVNHVLIDNKDTPWISTRNGISRFNGYFWEKQKDKDADANIEQAYSMTQDINSIFWIATKGDGIIRYDGETFNTYKSVNGIPSGFLRSTAAGKDGTVWFGTYRGVISFDGTTWKRYQIKEGLPSLQVNQVFIDSKNRAWAATTRGVSVFINGEWKSFTEKDGLVDNYAMTVTEDNNGNIYIGTKKGISKYNGDSFSSFLIEDDLSGHQITGVAIDVNNTLWFSLGDGGVESFNGKIWKHYSKKDGLSDEELNCVSVKNDGSIWFGGFNGVSIYRQGKWDSIRDDTKLLANVNAIVHDDNGSTWFATGGGLVHLKENQLERFSEKDGLQHKAVSSVLLEKDTLWIGTHKGALKVSRDWSKKSSPTMLKDIQIVDIEKDSKGILWFATINGVYRFNGKEWKRFEVSDGLADNRVFSVTVAQNGDIWFGTFGGLTKYDGMDFKSYSRGTGLPDEMVHDVAVDRDNQKWIATALGVSHLDDRLEFSHIGYSGLGARASLTLTDSDLNKNKELKETVQVTIKNLLLKTESIFSLEESGKDTGIFSLSTADKSIGFISSASKREDTDSVTVKQGFSNFLEAYYITLDKEKVAANAFWEDVVDMGNLDGNTIIDRYDAAIARKVIKGYVNDAKMYPGVDVNGDGTVGIEEEEYALKVNSGQINPYAKEGGNTKTAQIAVEAFRPQNLPWDVWKILATDGGKIELDKLSLEIPPGALREDTIIEVYQGERTPSPNGLQLLPVGKGYNLHPVNLTFDKPIKISLKYTDDDLKSWGITDENSLRLGLWVKNKYQVIASTVDPEKKQVEGELSVFPDFLDRPNRAPFARMRTSPITNILTQSNYFTILSSEENIAQNNTNSTLKNIAVAPTIQVIPPPDTIHYNAIGIDDNGSRLSIFTPAWSLEKEDGDGDIDQNGNFRATKDGIIYIQAHQDQVGKKMIAFLGTCSWCHYFGR